jgi:short-subunit dehydrogenase
MVKCGVSASCVHPGSVKTNIVNNTRLSRSMNEFLRTEKDIRQMFDGDFMVITPEKAARIILNGVRRNKRRILVGIDASVFDIMARLLPAGYQWFVTRTMSMMRGTATFNQ